TKRVSFSASLRCSQARISSILVSTNQARLRFSLGASGGCLVIKLIKPTKIFCSWPPHQSAFRQIRTSEAESDIRTTAAGVLWKANAAVRQKLGRLDPLDRVSDQLSEFLALLLGNRGPQILHFHQPLAHKNHHRHICNSCHPGIANQLRIECQQSIGRFRVAARSGLPLDEGASAIQSFFPAARCHSRNRAETSSPSTLLLLCSKAGR